jgi:hypothetical protein
MRHLGPKADLEALGALFSRFQAQVVRLISLKVKRLRSFKNDFPSSPGIGAN